MEMVKRGDYIVVYQPHGNDKNGNPIYIVNIFRFGCCVNQCTGLKLDKHGNIKIQSHNIEDDLEYLVNFVISNS